MVLSRSEQNVRYSMSLSILKGNQRITVEVAFQYINEFRENVLGFCNNIYNAEGGTHLTDSRPLLHP